MQTVNLCSSWKRHAGVQIDSVLEYLQNELDLKGEDLKKVVKKFPEVVNCSVERRLKANIEHMQKVDSLAFVIT